MKDSLIAARHFIDGGARPFVPDGWTIDEHREDGVFAWNSDLQKDALYFSKRQHGQRGIEGNQLRRELADKPVLNAAILDYLCANPHLIPDGWKGKQIFFWGTVYRNNEGDACVRYLHYWHTGRWFFSSGRLCCSWRADHPAALRAC